MDLYTLHIGQSICTKMLLELWLIDLLAIVHITHSSQIWFTLTITENATSKEISNGISYQSSLTSECYTLWGLTLVSEAMKELPGQTAHL